MTLDEIKKTYAEQIEVVWVTENLNELWDVEYQELFEALFEYYAFETGQMPYGTAKARDDDPAEWIYREFAKEVQDPYDPRPSRYDG